jgi:hypothetical protein
MFQLDQFDASAVLSDGGPQVSSSTEQQHVIGGPDVQARQQRSVSHANFSKNVGSLFGM